jgi:flagellar hook-length control protein FliK
MTDNGSFATQQVRTSAESGNAAALRHAGGKGKPAAAGDFLGLLFTHIDAEAGMNGLPGVALGKPDAKGSGLFGRAAGQGFTKTAAGDLKDTSLDAETRDGLTSVFDTLLHGTPASGADVTNALAAAGGDGKLEVSGADGKKAAAATIATGLSPDKLTAIAQKIAARIKAQKDAQAQGDATGAAGAALAATVQIVPPPAHRVPAFFGGAQGGHGGRGLQNILSASADAAEAAAAAGPAARMAAKLSAGLKGAARTGAAAEAGSEGAAGATLEGGQKSDAAMDALATKLNKLVVGANDSMGDEGPGGLPDEGKGAGGFHQILKVLEHMQSQSSNAGAGAAAAAGAKTAHVNTGASGGDAAAPVLAFSALGASLGDGAPGSIADGSGGWRDIYPESLAAAASPAHQMGLTGPAQFTSLVTHAASAGSAHPATQMVASAMVKAAAAGESKSFTIRLDPPELGKIQIDMDFKNKDSLKTHLVVDKPETYMMLQRDAHVLERALTNLGMNLAGGSLSFELSHGGTQSGGNGSGNNGHRGGKNGLGAVEDTETTETTMNWYVDEQTGRTRYSLLA